MTLQHLLRRGFTPGFRSADLISLFSLSRFPQSSSRSYLLQKAMLSCPARALWPQLRPPRWRGSLDPPPPSSEPAPLPGLGRPSPGCAAAGSPVPQAGRVCAARVPAPGRRRAGTARSIPAGAAPGQGQRDGGMRPPGWACRSRGTSAECGTCCAPRVFRWNTVSGGGGAASTAPLAGKSLAGWHLYGSGCGPAARASGRAGASCPASLW